jgi:L-ascorbate 6-phosphate lactonase
VINHLAQTLETTRLEKGEVALFWLGEAGFALKSSGERLIFIDAYLSRYCEKREGQGITSKRLYEPPLEANDITHGLMVTTHSHHDHLDMDSIAVVAR